jgi:hypothetical protein
MLSQDVTTRNAVADVITSAWVAALPARLAADMEVE